MKTKSLILAVALFTNGCNNVQDSENEKVDSINEKILIPE